MIQHRRSKKKNGGENLPILLKEPTNKPIKTPVKKRRSLSAKPSMAGQVSGLDTETVGGYAIVLATEHRAWEAHTFEQCVDPLIDDVRQKKIAHTVLMYNQGFDSQAILKYLPTENLLELLGRGIPLNDEDDPKERANFTIYDNRYRITYVKNKKLSIRDMGIDKGDTTKGGHSFIGYDLAQFYNYMHLDDAAKEFLGQRKIKNAITTYITTEAHLHRDDELFIFFEQNIEELMRYCKQDATLTKKLGDYLLTEVKGLFGYDMPDFISKTTLGKKEIKDTVGYLPKEDGKQKQIKYPKFLEDHYAGKLAVLAYHGGLFDCMKRGSFGEVTDIDISSAYPYHMEHLPNWNTGDFIPLESESDIRSDDKFGWIWCYFDYPLIHESLAVGYTFEEIHDDKVQLVTTPNMRNYFPTGYRWKSITLCEYRFLKEIDKIKECLGGFVWRESDEKPNENEFPNPFGWVRKIYNLKRAVKAKEGKKSYKYSLTKISMNSAYGVTAQSVGSAPFRNMFYASYITAETRVQICRMLRELNLEDDYISIATDGILLEGHISLPKKYTNSDLGSWDVEHWDSALVIGNGVYRLERVGMTRLDNIKTEPDKKQTTRGMLSYKGNFRDLLEKNRDKSVCVPDTKARPITMYQGVCWDRYTKDDINRFVKTARKLKCNPDQSKHWDNDAGTFGDLLNNAYVGRRFTITELDSLEIEQVKAKPARPDRFKNHYKNHPFGAHKHIKPNSPD